MKKLLFYLLLSALARGLWVQSSVHNMPYTKRPIIIERGVNV